MIEYTLSADFVYASMSCSTPNNCTCTTMEGDQAEHGDGSTLEHGWLDFDWSVWHPVDEPVTIRPDADTVAEAIVAKALRARGWDDEGRATLEEWLMMEITYKMGAVDIWSDGDDYCAADWRHSFRTAMSVRMMAHVTRYGLDDGEASLMAQSSGR